MHFTEVRVCKLLHYFLDRPELGNLVLQETLSMFLEFACRQDRTIIRQLQEVVGSSVRPLLTTPSLFSALRRDRSVLLIRSRLGAASWRVVALIYGAGTVAPTDERVAR